MEYAHSLAQQYDAADELAGFRNRFHLPLINAQSVVYLRGHSLGLQPIETRAYLEQELDDWARLGVEGHFHATNPWYYYHHFLTESTARLVGALPIEVVVMNSLTVNVNLLMVSFYRPEGQRRKIMIEATPFPSDLYAMQQQLRWHGLDPTTDLIVLQPRAGEYTLRTEDIVNAIREAGDTLALSMLSGVNFFTGQYFDIPAITKAAHEVGAVAGFDLAHAAGNVPLQLHDWNVDFAAWCSYKYLNSGPGGVGGVFVHERHANNPNLPRFAGWWGNDEKNRFSMPDEFVPQAGAAGWQISNAPVLSMAAHRASLALFDESGMERLRAKSERMSAFLFDLLDEINPNGRHFTILTPREPSERGCQVSLLFHENGRAVFDALIANNILVDWRHPNVIRFAAVPLYNRFGEVVRLVEGLKEGLESV